MLLNLMFIAYIGLMSVIMMVFVWIYIYMC